MRYNGANRKTTSMIQSRNQNKNLYWLMTTFELVCATILEILQTGTSHFISSTTFNFMIRKHIMLLIQRDIILFVRLNIILLLNQFNDTFFQI